MGGDGDSDDPSLFEQEMQNQGVRKHSQSLNRIAHERSVKPRQKRKIFQSNSGSLQPVSKPSTLAAAAVDKTLPGEPLLFVRNSVDKNLLRAFKRGQIPFAEQIDLHGMREMEAKRALERFLNDCQTYRCRCAQIIHGKGRNSEQPSGVLKPLTIHWLKQQREVIAFMSATERDGGLGATNILFAFD